MIAARTARVLDEGCREGQHLGAQVYVSRHGEVLADLAVGEEGAGVPMRTDTVNAWFSSGKPLTAVAIAQLWEAGRIDLEAPVAAYLPEFGAHGKERVLVRHLLNHTAGFRPADQISRMLPWADSIRAIGETPLEPGWIPGERAGYQLFSSWSILAELVRRLDGRPIEVYVEREILRPSGLVNCGLAWPPPGSDAQPAPAGRIYFRSQGRLQPHPVWTDPAVAAIVRPGGSARGSIRELGRFYEVLAGLRRPEVAGEERLCRPETVATFTRPSRVGMFDETFRHLLDWGLGFAVNSNHYGPETVPYGFGSAASAGTFGHGGSQSSLGFVDPAHGVVVAWMCNGMIGEAAHQVRARRINAAIYADLGLEPPRPPDASSPVPGT